MLSSSLIDNRSSCVGRVGVAPAVRGSRLFHISHNGEVTMSTNWAEYGIKWSTEKVSRQMGDHRSDRVELKYAAEIAVPADLTKLRESLGDALLIGFLDGSSMRVAAQDVNRRYIEACMKGAEKYDTERLRELVWARLSGKTIRRASVVVKEVKVRLLPNGKAFTGTTAVEFEAEARAACIDLGMDAETAKMVAAKMAVEF